MKFQKASEADFYTIQKFYWNVIENIHRNNINNENLGWEKAICAIRDLPYGDKKLRKSRLVDG